MAPSLPGTGSRRNATRGSRSSPAASIKGEDSFKREGRSSRGAEKHDSDSEEQSKGSSSPSRPRRPARKIPSKSKQRRTGDMKDGDRDEDEDEDEEDQEGAEPDEDASTKNEPSEPPEDVEEIEGEIDEAGESKVTKDGELLGGRQYRCRSFKLPARGDRIYMLSMDPARVLGFRDSYLFFLKNPQLVRVNTTVEERQWMIENGMLMANFKSKLIAVVTARSIFKSFGARIIKNGRSRVDDYYEANATEEDALNDSDGDASRTGNGNAPGSVNGGNSYQDEDAPSGSARRKRNLTHDDSQRLITGLNWMYESAMAVRNFNARLKELRKETPRFMDPHTNLEQVPSALQPTRCEIQPVSEPRPAKKPRHSNDTAISAVEAPVPLSSEPPVFAVPRSIGPIVDLNVKVTIKPGAPLPPQIHDPSVWAVIPEDVRRTLQEEVLLQAIDEDGDQDSTKYPIAIMPGHYQAAFPLHQVRFQQPYRVVLPHSMAPHAHYVHHLWTTEQASLAAEKISKDQAAQQQLQQQQQQQQQQHQLQQQQQQVHQQQQLQQQQQQLQQQQQQQMQQQQQQQQHIQQQQQQQRGPRPQAQFQQSMPYQQQPPPTQFQPQMQQTVPGQHVRRH